VSYALSDQRCTRPPEYRLVRTGEGTDGLAGILPPGLAAAEAFGDVAPDPLFSDESSVVSTAVELRKLEFGRGRSCAHRAMVALGFAPEPVLAAVDRAPIWPAGIVGSISHCREYCCAVVGIADRWATIGVDAELLQPMEQELQERILSTKEQRWLEHLDPTIPWTCVVFSIKEAFYKAWSHLARGWLGFHDVLVRADPVSGRFEAELVRVPPPSCASLLRRIEGRFCFDGHNVLSAIAVPKPSIPRSFPSPDRRDNKTQ